MLNGHSIYKEQLVRGVGTVIELAQGAADLAKGGALALAKTGHEDVVGGVKAVLEGIQTGARLGRMKDEG
jgi:hypothetical protein